MANAALGNSVTGALELVQRLWHGNAGGTAAALAAGGLKQGLPLPGNGLASDGIVGTVGNGVLNAATGAEEITTLSGTVVMDGLAAPIALVKFAYDAGTLLYGTIRGCNP